MTSIYEYEMTTLAFLFKLLEAEMQTGIGIDMYM